MKRTALQLGAPTDARLMPVNKPRGLDAKLTFRHLVSAVAFGLAPKDIPTLMKDLPIEERIATARAIACTPAEVEPTVVWLGYQGRLESRLNAGHVSFFNAHWAVPNTIPDAQSYEHKSELWELVRRGDNFKVATRVDEESDVDFLVRVDLGETTAASAVPRAVKIVDTILNASIYNAGGIHPILAQYGVLRTGQIHSFSYMAPSLEPTPPEHQYGMSITGDAIDEFGPRIAEALAREELPQFLGAALNVQTLTDYPFRRDTIFHKASEISIGNVIPLADQVVQHMAAHAEMNSNDTFDLLGERWPYARWLTDVKRAVQMCLIGFKAQRESIAELVREL